MIEGLPTRTVTFLMAHVEEPARLGEPQPEEVAMALPWLRATVTHTAALNKGILCAGLGTSNGFGVVFARASNAVACALYLQLESMDPFAVRIGLHSVEADSKEGGTRVAMNGAAWLRDIACGGETVLSSATAALAFNGRPSDVSFQQLEGYSHDQCRPVRLCHPGLRDRSML